MGQFRVGISSSAGLCGCTLGALEQLASTPLFLRPEHIAAIYVISPIHENPVGRVLIAQATVEGLALETFGGEIGRYASKGLRVVG